MPLFQVEPFEGGWAVYAVHRDNPDDRRPIGRSYSQDRSQADDLASDLNRLAVSHCPEATPEEPKSIVEAAKRPIRKFRIVEEEPIRRIEFED